MDVDATVLDHHALDHGADELLPSVEVERGERTADTVDEGLQIRLEMRLLLGGLPLGVQHLDTAVDVSPPLTQPSLPLPELIEIDESGLIGVEQSVFLAIQLGQLLLQRGQVVGQAVVPRRLGLDLQARVPFANQGWVLEMTADLAPDECIQLVRPQVPLWAAADGTARAQHVFSSCVSRYKSGETRAAAGMAASPTSAIRHFRSSNLLISKSRSPKGRHYTTLRGGRGVRW